ncbi:MAG: tyrosine--tRNA ligase [candidate division Zixibacteria bacterium]|nr:tyrosine--tRNA ligase [candidate division Zixibacteria bacterium]
MNPSEFSPSVLTEVDRQMEILSRGAVDVLPLDEFKLKLARSVRDKVPLRIKQGFDPTAPDIHLGHAVCIRKLKQFQDLGHQVILIVGDYTALVGDPSGRSATRPQLPYEQILKNAVTYEEQFFKILDRSRTEVVHNGDWFKKLEFSEVMHLAAKYTVARILERDDFAERFKAETPISVHELLYPLMQGYDSVAIRADIEIGATEQKFNLLAGRTIQEAYGLEPQCILTMPVLVGVDGERRMSKSLGNYIGVDESPREMFGKVMSIPDRLIGQYFLLATDSSMEKLDEVTRRLNDGHTNPMDLKRELGIIIVDSYHPHGSGQAANEEFTRMFSEKELPDDMPEIGPADLLKMELDPKKVYLVHLLTRANLAKSGSEARQLIEAGSVRMNGEKVSDPALEFALDREIVLKVGKRRFLKLKSE